MNKGYTKLFLHKQHKMEIFTRWYPMILAFLSFLLSVSLWFSGRKEEGQFVGIWVPSILAAGIYFKLEFNKGRP